jgi:hypothetical protein
LTLGAEPKKIAWLAGLVVLAGIVYYVSSSDSPAPAAPRVAAGSSPAPVPPAANGPAGERRSRTAGKSQVREFKLIQGVRDPKDRPDPATIDPTIRWDLLAKVQNIEVGPAGRNLFQFGTAPAIGSALVTKLPAVKQIAMNGPPVPPSSPVPSGPPPPPQAPPMTFKYYGYKISKSDGHKAAFLLDGDDILIAGENDTVKRHYRVVKIGNSSITIEDVDFKSTQTLPIQETVG